MKRPNAIVIKNNEINRNDVNNHITERSFICGKQKQKEYTE